MITKLPGCNPRCITTPSGKMRGGGLLMLLLLLAGGVTTADAAIPVGEREVLIDLYNSTNGAGWTRNANWLGGEGTECTWAGIACNDTQSHVIRVELNSNRLAGTLPSLGGLTALQGFSVTSNRDLTGPIPSLAGLAALQYFIVSNNQLTGPIPAFSGLPALHNIQLNNNRLTGSIPSLRELPALDYFSVSSNLLTGSIPALDGLTALQTFVVAINRLTGPIPALDTLTALQYADFSVNILTGPIPSLSKLTALRSILVHANQLSGPIPSLSGLTALRSVWAHSNQLSGPIPSFAGLTNLAYFRIEDNQLTALPSFSGATVLAEFSADNNRLAGTIPSLVGLTALSEFSVNSNRLTGQIPSLGGLTALQSFSAENNQLTGPIPSLSGAPFLTKLGVGNNQLSGPVPAAPGALKAFVSNICGNRLVTSGNAANDSAWVKAQSPIVVADGNWLACQNPVFHMTVSGRTNPATANISADVFFRPQDVGATATVYVFALAPASLVKNVPLTALSNHIGPVTRSGNPADIIEACVLAQLVAGELTFATTATLQATSTGVLGSAGATVSVLNGVSTALVTGAVFYVGYGPDSTSMMNNGIHRRAVAAFGNKSCQVLAPQTGWWWNPAEDGRGFGIEVRGSNLFMSGYLYDETGHATWVVSPGPIALDGSLFTGTIYQVANGQTLADDYKVPSPPTSPGTITLTFADARNGTLTWPGGTIAIRRFDYIIGSGNGVTPAFVPENGWWWNAAESGRGFCMEIKNNYAFIAGYMYEPDGRPVWYLAQNPMVTPQSFSSTWVQVGNGQSLAGPYRKANIINSNIGPVSIQFQDAANAVMTLPGDRQLAITRQRF